MNPMFRLNSALSRVADSPASKLTETTQNLSRYTIIQGTCPIGPSTMTSNIGVLIVGGNGAGAL